MSLGVRGPALRAATSQRFSGFEVRGVLKLTLTSETRKQQGAPADAEIHRLRKLGTLAQEITMRDKLKQVVCSNDALPTNL